MHVMKKGILYAVLASVLWAIVNPFIKQGLSYDFSPMNFAGLRFTVVGIILFAYTCGARSCSTGGFSAT